MMRKKINYINITPIPSYIPRQLAIDILHSHGEVIQLNPLVIDYKPTKAPREAPADEFYSTWYDITQRIQYVPGTGKLGSGKINFNGCFHDMPWGLQTHIYAPAGVDLRNKWQICGNQPGEPPEQREMGIGAPPEGLYLREDIEIKCNFTMVSFVKKETKAASKILVDRLIKKAELLDAGVLHAMMEDGKLRTLNPADRTSTMPTPMSPQLTSAMPMSPGQQYVLPRSPTNRYRPQTGGGYQPPGSPAFAPQQMAPHYQGVPQTYQNVVMELPGDYYHAPQDSAHLQAPDRYSHASEAASNSPNSNDGRWSVAASDHHSSISSRPTSYASDHGSMRSPGMEQKGFAAELPAMAETREEHDGSRDALKKLEGQDRNSQYPADQKQNYRPYNPESFSRPPPPY
ncbi:uncharacterized protein BDZ99DRAFT_456979 [Mytilinidion resinicola]|uniref:DUF7053 domain-containing protein n=1 Tax=Mytilinidion resinicola TaxID=574789 RepID=A0A6A6Z856_9PEZI|nr:uncharacterized protein BDZ99DRAFT_456979 [Mytilinidion resinicola]KAF2817226.1 hypothetical protein BDZ99DRAFT_456979 [Mytilinidion resinicola]